MMLIDLAKGILAAEKKVSSHTRVNPDTLHAVAFDLHQIHMLGSDIEKLVQ